MDNIKKGDVVEVLDWDQLDSFHYMILRTEKNYVVADVTNDELSIVINGKKFTFDKDRFKKINVSPQDVENSQDVEMKNKQIKNFPSSNKRTIFKVGDMIVLNRDSKLNLDYFDTYKIDKILNNRALLINSDGKKIKGLYDLSNFEPYENILNKKANPVSRYSKHSKEDMDLIRRLKEQTIDKKVKWAYLPLHDSDDYIYKKSLTDKKGIVFRLKLYHDDHELSSLSIDFHDGKRYIHVKTYYVFEYDDLYDMTLYLDDKIYGETEEDDN